MKKLWFFSLFLGISTHLIAAMPKRQGNIILDVKQIELPEFTEIWNPSLLKTSEGFILTFRYCLNPASPRVSSIGAALLDEHFNPISSPQLLAIRQKGDAANSQAEDARLIALNDRVYLLYNDNVDSERDDYRRDMFIAELEVKNNSFNFLQPLKMYYPEHYLDSPIQKNWVPFDWHGSLLLAYSLNPHEIIAPNLTTGECTFLCRSKFNNKWLWGSILGGTPGILCNGEYLAFFYSYLNTGKKGHFLEQWFLGAYKYSSEPPFEITAISTVPIKSSHDCFFNKSSPLLPGGFTLAGSKIHLAFGKNNKVWIATLDQGELNKSLKPVGSKGSQRQVINASALAAIRLKKEACQAIKEVRGWCSDEKASFLIDCVITLQPETILEIGVFEGKSLIPMAYALKSNHKGKIFGIDPWDPQASTKGLKASDAKWWQAIDHQEVYQSLVNNIAKLNLSKYVHLIRSTSARAKLPIEEIDLLHIDGNHSEEAFYKDVTQWVPKVRRGGLIILNDIDWETAERAVQWLDSNCTKLTELRNSNKWGIWTKP